MEQYGQTANANRWVALAQQRSLMSNKYIVWEYYWLDRNKTILSKCVRIENEVAYFQVIGLGVLYTERDCEVVIKATVK
jgi:hypothetical protein